MTLKIYNTLTRKKEEFVPIKDEEVSMYTCGPTVYNYAHIGNFRANIIYDLFKRYLDYKGYEVKHVMNITDVDDKTIRDSQAQNKSLKEFTEFYTEAFLEDLDSLNVDIPDIMPKATEEIKEMVEMIKVLLDKGFAYKSDDGVYFSINKFEEYGKLANLDLTKLKVGASGRTANDEYEKEDAHDFALWKFWDEKDGDVFWETELGKGRPGWHIECSVMSSKYLGQPFDVHMGGIDLIFPHHTNEIAQSEAVNGTKFCNYWLHNAHLIVNGEKMSKSANNFFTLKDLKDKGYDPIAVRYELIKTHYRQTLDFKEDELKSVPNTLQKFYDFLDKLDEIKEQSDKVNDENVDLIINTARSEFEKNLDDDLNISGALASIFEFMTEINKRMDDLSKQDADKVKQTMQAFDSVLAIMHHEKGTIDQDIEALIQQREDARISKDFATADKIRDVLLAKGIVLEDTPNGVRWKKK